jgi:hypothetical protein
MFTALFVLMGLASMMLLNSDITWIAFISWVMDWLTGD